MFHIYLIMKVWNFIYYNIKELVAIRWISIRNWNYLHTLDNNFLFGFCKNRTLNHKFPTECGRWQNMNLFIYMYSNSRFLCVLWRIVKVDRALHNVFCIVTLSIVIYVDNICIRWETHYPDSEATSLYSFSLILRALHYKQQIPVDNLWFYPIGTRTHDIPHSRRAR
jgi:hypothetical protein